MVLALVVVAATAMAPALARAWMERACIGVLDARVGDAKERDVRKR